MSKETEFLVLAGGMGERLKSITGQTIPKYKIPIRYGIRGIDIILSELEKIKAEATFNSNSYVYQCEEIIKKTNHRLLWQNPGGITQAVLQTGNRVILIASDCIFPFEQLRKMIEKHQPGTISWAVTEYQTPLMDSYAGCDIVDGRIVGRVNKSIIRSPTLIVDPEVLRPFVNDAAKDDFYLTVMQKVEKENLERVKSGQRSILNAFFLEGPIMDYGTPSRLKVTEMILDDILHPKKHG